MDSFKSIIDAFGYAELATVLGRPAGTVSAWKTRGMIPSDCWATIVSEAKRRGIGGVSYELLARLEAQRGTRPGRGEPSPTESLEQADQR